MFHSIIFSNTSWTVCSAAELDNSATQPHIHEHCAKAAEEISYWLGKIQARPPRSRHQRLPT
ncbi:hypothetical protein GN956_G26268, partial [Arapaima gigas]